ncbi:pentatricopeptide repeat-containing protein At1g50270 [Vicia villosa]|uniref:pentatricopeptide repeat-containing protein At1g50270 n=1 Tax=Vicia villosa TaxID=3911 RepID=UPI00273C8D14|nr:pentatricopeptide repeat-containing protein At1g50270 [Vicia villosa]XP_058730186.1 pentatricopeptide repeat-containing protein At1g50270 [Vicia villosa]
MLIVHLRNAIVSLSNKHQNLKQWKQVQSIIITSSLYSFQDAIFLTKLVQCAPFSQTQTSSLRLLLNTIHTPNTRLFNKVITSFSISSHPETTLLCYAKMREKGVEPDKHTFPLLLKMFSKGVIVHDHDPFMVYAQIFKLGFDRDRFVGNALISAFGCSGFMESACRVFDESPEKDVVAWTALINGYVKNGLPGEALKCFVEMRSNGAVIDGVTVASILRAAAMVCDDYFGKCVHGFYVAAGRVSLDGSVYCALVDMYFKCGQCEDACKVFDEMPYRDVVAWTVLVAGFVQCNKYQDALCVFQSMLLDNVIPNEFTLTSVLSACAHVGALDQGRSVHRYLDCNKVKLNVVLGMALVDMYAKCGCIDEALRVFENLQVKNVHTWTAMINGLAVHGDALGALNVFSRMLEGGIQPNEVTFLGVLGACSHGGFVEEGKQLFELMRHTYHLKPNMEHYGCMVDLLGRAGYLEEAKQIIDNMPMKPSPGVLVALLGACVSHKDFLMGKHIGNILVNLQLNHNSGYALLTNLYSMCQNWEAAAQVRKLMKGMQVEKTPGYSWIEVAGSVHEFKAFDHSHSKLSGVYLMLENLILQLKLVDPDPWNGDLDLAFNTNTG